MHGKNSHSGYSENVFVLGGDIVSFCIRCLLRLEEFNREGEADEHGRFDALSSHAVKHGYLERPVVDQFVTLLKRLLNQTGFFDFSFDGQVCLRLSHDVDAPFLFEEPTLVRTLLSEFRRNPGLETFRSIFSGILKGVVLRYSKERSAYEDDPYNTFSWLLRFYKQRGLHATFFLMGYSSPHSLDGSYCLSSPRIVRLANSFIEHDHGIGVHYSYACMQSAGILQRNIAEFKDFRRQFFIEESTEINIRAHYLRWRPELLKEIPSVTQAISEHTLGYAQRIGFRSGTSKPYEINLSEICPHPVTIVPLAVMDCSLIDPRYMNLGVGERALKKISELVSSLRNVDGDLSLLWHNERLASLEERNLFTSVVSLVTDNGD